MGIESSLTPVNDFKYYNKLDAWEQLKAYTLDFGITTNNIAFTDINKRDDKQLIATLNITPYRNLIFNGQLLGETVNLNDDSTMSGFSSFEKALQNNSDFLNTVNYHQFSYKPSSTSTDEIFGIKVNKEGDEINWTYLVTFGDGIKNIRYNNIGYSYSDYFGGDRLKWDSKNNKYLINQFGANKYTVDAANTDPIPVASKKTTGLMSYKSYTQFSAWNEQSGYRLDFLRELLKYTICRADSQVLMMTIHPQLRVSFTNSYVWISNSTDITSNTFVVAINLFYSQTSLMPDKSIFMSDRSRIMSDNSIQATYPGNDTLWIPYSIRINPNFNNAILNRIDKVNNANAGLDFLQYVDSGIKAELSWCNNDEYLFTYPFPGAIIPFSEWVADLDSCDYPAYCAPFMIKSIYDDNGAPHYWQINSKAGHYFTITGIRTSNNKNERTTSQYVMKTYEGDGFKIYYLQLTDGYNVIA